ncbi:restriction endonuclease subunit S [Ligilactobacillus salivarius]
MDNKKNGIPKLRFPGFTGAWEQRKLGEVGKTFTGLSGKTKEDFGHGDAHFVTYMNVYSNPISDPNMVENVEIDTKQQEVKKGDVFFTTSSETPEEVGMSSVWLSDAPHIYLNSFCFGFRPIVNIFNPYYLAYLLRSNNIRNKMMILAQGISRYNISKNKVMKLNVTIPNIREQQKIGEFFKQLDFLIALHQRKLEHLQEQKKGLLQKMFPKNGETVPEVRFPGFTDAWEQRKLGEVGKTFTGLSGKTKEDFGHGDAHFVTYMNVYSNPISDPNMVENVEIDTKQQEVKKGDVFFTTSSETPEEVGMSSVWLSDAPHIYLNSFCFGFRPIVNIFNPYYLAYLLRSNNIRNKMMILAQGISRYNISKNKVMKLNVTIPNIREQQKIGEFFKQLDFLIALHQRKLEHLELMKKGLLQQMFV